MSTEMRADKPGFAMPPGACDTHMHIFDPRFATVRGLAVPPRDATVTAYRALQQRLGLQRVVIVQPASYGADNACTLDAMAALGDAARGVAVIDPAAPFAEWQRLDALGMRGIRFHMFAEGALGWDDLAPMAAKAAELGWHVQMQLPGEALAEREKTLRELPCALVVDHIGRFTAPVARDQGGWPALRRLVDTGHCWVKLSAPYHGSKSGAPAYEDIGSLARDLVAAAPERLLWASNWPHPSAKGEPPDDADLLGLLADWAPAAAQRQAILVDNPARLYGFQP
jgi:D-galactarolactone isomerase